MNENLENLLSPENNGLRKFSKKKRNNKNNLGKSRKRGKHGKSKCMYNTIDFPS